MSGIKYNTDMEFCDVKTEIASPGWLRTSLLQRGSQPSTLSPDFQGRTAEHSSSIPGVHPRKTSF